MEPVRADDEVVAGFAGDGVACLRSVLDPGEVAAAAGPAMDHPLFAVVWPADPAD